LCNGIDGGVRLQENFFLEMKNLFEKNKENASFDQADIYLLIRYLSFYPATMGIADKANMYATGLPAENLGQYLFYSIPRRTNAPFISIVKQTKKDTADTLLKKVMGVFYCGKYHAEQILSIYELGGIDLKSKLGL
jgi:hypothetical protein